jgi:iron complex outermembrane recepter protein
MRVLILLIFFFSSLVIQAQFNLLGSVHDEMGQALPGSIVQIEGTFLGRSCDAKGNFLFPDMKAGSFVLKVTHLGFKDVVQEIDLNSNLNLEFQLSSIAIQAEAFTVIGFRANTEVPMAYLDISKEELQKRNLGVDVPALLDMSPSLYFTSDAGTGIGYTYMRLRGSDQSNINVMINGVPLNDSESQGVYWVDLPDLASSAENIQIQRGVGTSVNGAGGFGGSVNVQTQALAAESYGKISLSGGSFNTRRISVQAGSGLLNDHWSLDTRISRISSDGYIDRSAASLESYYLAAGYVNGKNTLRLIGFGGHEVTQQAWYGVPRARLENDTEGMLGFALDNGFSEANTELLLNSGRTYNYYTYDQEVDDYQQQHYQLHFSRKINRQFQASASLHYTRGLGFFEQFQDADNYYDDTSYSDYGLQDPFVGTDTLTTSDFVRRRWLDNHFYGFTSNLTWRKGKWNAVLGIAANQYEGGHYGEVIKANFLDQLETNPRYYDNDALKKELSAYLRSTYALSKEFSAYIDLQQRVISYDFLGVLNDGNLSDQQVEYSFFNPKFGLTYANDKGHRAFVSFARAHKEPNRDDLVISTVNSRPEAQRLDDVELGYSYRSTSLALEAVIYNMSYKDQLINTGEINDVGESIRTNVADSYRRGLELTANVKLCDRWSWKANATLSKNIIRNHQETVLAYDEFYNSSLELEEYGDAPISFSPSYMSYSEWTYSLVKKNGNQLDLSLCSKYVGEQHLDNTGNKNKVIDAFLVNDFRIDWNVSTENLKGLNLTFQIRNLMNEVYESNGWTYRYKYEGQEVSYDALFPQAGRNFLAGISLYL